MFKKINTKSFFIVNILFVLCLFLFANNRFSPVAGEPTTYSVTLNQTTPATISSGVYNSGNETYHGILFDYVDAMDNASYHTQLKANTGSLSNDSTTQITSITQLTAVFSGSLTLTTGTSSNPSTNPVSLVSGSMVTFTDSPYFFKIAAGATIAYLTSLVITYTCTPLTSSSSETLVSTSLTISRDTWPSLSTYPAVETSVAFSGYNFKYFDAGNYTSGVIQGKNGSFYLFNSDALGTITSIVITLSTTHTSPTMYSGIAQNPTTNPISASVNNLIHTYSFGSGSYSYFRLLNTSGAIYIMSIVINFTIGGSPSSSSSSSIASSSSSSLVSSSSSSIISSSSGAYDYNHVTPSYSGTYYAGISEALRGSELIIALDDILDADAASGFSYSGMSAVFPFTDADPANPSSGKILSFYSGIPSVWSSMNREHTWPDSRGGNYIETDPHMVRPSLTSENSSRGNSFYNVSPTAWDPASFGVFKYRGIAARIIMYCAVKAQESGLNLVDLTTDSTGNLSMGKLSTLLQWNLDYEIDATELLRNDVLVSKYGHCRNPFIDDRNYGCKIWGSTNATTRSICGM